MAFLHIYCEFVHDRTRRVTSDFPYHAYHHRREVEYDAQVSQGRICPALCIAHRADALPSVCHEFSSTNFRISYADRSHE